MLTDTGLVELKTAINNYQIAQGYFSHILSAQTAIFSTIIIVVMGLIAYLNWKVSSQKIREEVKKEVENEIKDRTAKMENEFNSKSRLIAEKISLIEEMSKTLSEQKKNLTEQGSSLSRQRTKITTLQGQINKTLGHLWDSQNEYHVSFLWWNRAANNFIKSGQEHLARISLKSAKKAAEKIKAGSSFTSEDVGEYQSIFSSIDDKLYRIEKDALDKAFKDALDRKPAPPVPPAPPKT